MLTPPREILPQEPPKSVDVAATVARLVADGRGPQDIADSVRASGCPLGDLSQAMRAAGSSPLDMVAAVKHASGPCDHDVQGDVGTLPNFPDKRHPLDAGEQDLRVIAGRAWKAVQAANDPVQFVDFGGLAHWVKASDATPAAIEEVTRPRMSFVLGEVGEWFVENDKGRRAARAPRDVAEHLLADPHPPLPRLRRLVTVPVFDASGRLVVRPGYHRESGLFLAPRGLRLRRVAHHPTAGDVREALGLITEDLLGQFDFVDPADLTNAVALGLHPYVRELISGPTPLHVVTKPVPGSGGSLLVESLLAPAIGAVPAMQVLPVGEAEVQRRITAALMANPAAIIFDNVKVTLNSGQLCGALTATTWEDREIRTSRTVVLPVTNAWVATGNEVGVDDEIARRSVPIRLDPHTDRPFERTGWRHALPSWALEQRGDLVWAYLTLGQKWVAEGMSKGSLPMGKFEAWAGVMSGITEVVGLPALQGNWREWFERRPREGELQRKVVAAWSAELGEKGVKAAELLPVLGPLFDLDPAAGRSAETALGSRLRKLQGTLVDGYEVVGHEVSGSTTWRLVRRGA